jgi:hypothetical protein
MVGFECNEFRRLNNLKLNNLNHVLLPFKIVSCSNFVLSQSYRSLSYDKTRMASILEPEGVWCVWRAARLPGLQQQQQQSLLVPSKLG